MGGGTHSFLMVPETRGVVFFFCEADEGVPGGGHYRHILISVCTKPVEREKHTLSHSHLIGCFVLEITNGGIWNVTNTHFSRK